MRGSVTRAVPSSWVVPCSSEKVPSGRPCSATASRMARPTSSDVPGCAGWPLTTTGQPAASAEAVSPPATENASGKLLAPNTATGPTGTDALPQIRAGQRGAVGQRGVDADAVPAAVADDGGEQPQLADRTGGLAGHPARGQAGLGGDPLGQRRAERLDVGGDAVQERGPLLGGGPPIDREGRRGQGGRLVHLGRVRPRRTRGRARRRSRGRRPGTSRRRGGRRPSRSSELPVSSVGSWSGDLRDQGGELGHLGLVQVGQRRADRSGRAADHLHAGLDDADRVPLASGCGGRSRG